MNLSLECPPDELLLAKLAIAKLAKLMHGLLSVGMATVAMEPPTAMNFLEGRDKPPLAFLEVLRCTGVRPDSADKVKQLRLQVEQIGDAMSQFHRLFLNLAQWRDMSAEDVRTDTDRFGDSYVDFCRLLGEFSALLGMEADFSDQARQDRNYLEGVIATLPIEISKMPVSVSAQPD